MTPDVDPAVHLTVALPLTSETDGELGAPGAVCGRTPNRAKPPTHWLAPFSLTAEVNEPPAHSVPSSATFNPHAP